MVKFGGHIEAVREGDLKGRYFLVKYNDTKKSFENVSTPISSDEVRQKFIKTWNQALADAEDDLRKHQKELWSIFFRTLAPKPPIETRGIHPANALKLFVENSKPGEAQGALNTLTQISQAATTNSEGLRKLVKKFDRHQNEQLSLELLPTLYTSPLYTSQLSIQEEIGILLQLLEDPGPTVQLDRRDSEYIHERLIKVRFEELDWLKRLAESLPKKLLARLVAHRGFHNIKDRNHRRPLENSLSAFEAAWSSGIHLCECDIAITKDGKLVLGHDENFLRLALDSTSENAARSIGDLTFRELISLPLKSGSRPPLLVDVLRSARAISDHSKLVIEIKPGNESSSSALARLLLRHPDLQEAVAMIMSFDAAAMHQLRNDLSALKKRSPISGSFLGSYNGIFSYDHLGEEKKKSEHGLSALGLSLSHDDLESLQKPILEGENKSKGPKLMLLTVADPPNIPCELQVGVDDLSPVESWLRTSNGALDGVYLQYEKSMLTPGGAEALRKLSEKFLIGVWAYAEKDPDDYDTFEYLVQNGNCSFVNTDLPQHFKKDILVKTKA